MTVRKKQKPDAAISEPLARRPAQPPTLLGGIDIGSTAVRLNISECRPGQPPKLLEELTHPVATGTDTFRYGHILPETIRAINGVLVNFIRMMDEYGVRYRRAVCSSAIREASNREILVDRIRHNSGVELEILDAVEESRLVYQALVPWLRQGLGSYSMALNLGGGSTEIMILRGEDLLIGGVKRLGVSRLFHTYGQSANQNKGELLRAMATNIVNSTKEVYQEYNISNFYLINRILYRAFRSDPAAIPGDNDFVLPAVYLQERLSAAYKLSLLEVGRHFNMGLADAELLVPAMMILDCFITASQVDRVTFTNTEMLSGLITEMAMSLNAENPLMSFRRQMVRSARAVGEQYFYDRAHARVVTDFSLQLFDALRDMLDLDDRDRLLLELAAVLHDIGMYVSEREHHRHSAYLITWADIVGVNETDRRLIANIARYHRKDAPSPDDPGFMSLPLKDRIRVGKLAGILRMADVLDRGHTQIVKNIRIEVTGETLCLHVHVTGDLGIILDALPKKSDLLEMVTGLRVLLRHEMPKP